MQLSELTAVSPVDGRYRSKISELDTYFSEFGLIRYRVLVEIEYFIELCKIPLKPLKEIDADLFPKFRSIYENFTIEDALRIKAIENTTNHDVKAVEYFIKEKFDVLGIGEAKEFIHFGLTSQDINNTAIPYSLRDAIQQVFYPILEKVIATLSQLAVEWEKIPMLARTHGQPASPTRLGKELMVFVERLNKQLDLLKDVPCSAKFGGATGNFNAHVVAFPDVDWVDFSNRFVGEVLRLERLQTTTQISHYDDMAAIFDNLKRINTILIDLDRDMWTYISMDYFKQKINKNEVGSSAMPHKVNPIDFENSEGNLGMANAIYEHLAAKLPVSRLQRDLTDSTVLRNIGVPMAHTLIALKSLQKGLGKLVLNEDKIKTDLEANWSVVAEAIQTILRREGYPKPYEALKDLTRTNHKIDKNVIHEFINSLAVTDDVKEELKKITPQNYTGIYY
ncbi:MAG TPA: adenylosuccinate lyase [Marinilabiliales bacterium]|jgi:adenylosuccinate lyase|nr:MAG: adenylosuccinate lyase [Bacteroidetes bacterium GWA2_40_14]OFX56617.1 MAG: adenylosuccinate lyase [Bacteroidetes bacterium GWC2_40_13]OFX71817.1 MAG: adenylosuccinate lyase [Bacteroidetes bacterium GWD2_40_43]OFX94615.1 MAG: adenylosuccinate lyase [Bacteroidetes bacterium GWE2_40_63]OFY22423.1 MAG: adenylosuccinate lyase [Bacteroidetes bacterium GWF2_40_13]OFZ24382.1 MAG: adenylosuccinate lyase [Bacteroidetes bacterium RIFOXYC2_FULL_40_12]HAM98380.1 adenylosuccinate lyase [Marinilabil